MKLVEKLLLPMLIFLMFYVDNDTPVSGGMKILICAVILIDFFYSNGSILHIERSNRAMILITIFCLYSAMTAYVMLLKPSINWVNIYTQLLCFIILVNYYHTSSFHISNMHCFFIIFGLLIQILTNERHFGRFYLRSMKDSNYSGYYIFLWFVLLDIKKKRLAGMTVATLGLTTLSRSYLLCVVSYLLVSRLKFLKEILQKILEKINLSFFMLCLISIILVVVIGNIFINQAANYQILDSDNQNILERMQNLYDGSNVLRFRANVIFINEVTSNFAKYKWGIAYQNFSAYTKIVGVAAPHNALFQGFLKYGIISILYFILYAAVFSKQLFIRNVTITIPLFLNIMFLGLGIMGIDILLLAIILLENSKAIFPINKGNYSISSISGWQIT